MIIDLNEHPVNSSPKTYDVCIIGAGVAGITLANQLAAMGRHILLLEAGNREFSTESQDVYKGKNTGRPYFKLAEDRLRFLGGSSNHWAGWCRPLDEHDFKKHAHIPHSGWPISKADLDPFHDTATQILELPDKNEDAPLADSDNTFQSIDFQYSPPVRFGEKYEQELRDNARIDLFLNANVTNILLNDNLDKVTTLHVRNYTNTSNQYEFTAKKFVLATGGIENPRLLLNFRDQFPSGIGNTNDLVGRYFMEHPAILVGYYVTEEDLWPFDKDKEVHFSPTPEKLISEKIANIGLRTGELQPPPDTLYKKAKQRLICTQEAVHEFINQFHDVWCPPMPVYTGGYIHTASEQTPNPNSRVSLSDEKDKFGLQRANMDWQLLDIDRYTIKRTVTLFGEYIATQKTGNIKLIDWLQNDTDPVPSIGEDPWLGAGSHHMGTTRMASTASEGVVDKNCQVFGINNFYIAGSSVFTTGGHANPTFTIVQLTLRLGEHINQSLDG
jgi:choline dehydrogenase-like flavoprotein